MPLFCGIVDGVSLFEIPLGTGFWDCSKGRYFGCGTRVVMSRIPQNRTFLFAGSFMQWMAGTDGEWRIELKLNDWEEIAVVE
jgi:hypothetical protein